MPRARHDHMDQSFHLLGVGRNELSRQVGGRRDSGVGIEGRHTPGGYMTPTPSPHSPEKSLTLACHGRC